MDEFTFGIMILCIGGFGTIMSIPILQILQESESLTRVWRGADDYEKSCPDVQSELSNRKLQNKKPPVKEIPKIEGKHRCVMCGAPFDEDFSIWNRHDVKAREYSIYIYHYTPVHMCKSCYALFSESGKVYAYQKRIIIPLEFV